MRRLSTREAADILGVPIDAKIDDLKKRWKELAREYHPDLNPGDKEKEKKFKILNEAYNLLAYLRDGTRAARAIEEEMFDDEFETWINIILKSGKSKKQRRERIEHELNTAKKKDNPNSSKK